MKRCTFKDLYDDAKDVRFCTVAQKDRDSTASKIDEKARAVHAMLLLPLMYKM